MREIKFRAYDILTKKMWQWEEHNAFSTNKGSIKQWFTDHDLKIMQYTGFKDKKGKEIYEGDIVEETHNHDDLFEEDEEGETVKYRWAVEWSDELGAFVDDEGELVSEYLDLLEVVGNIYQNKKLLKK